MRGTSVIVRAIFQQNLNDKIIASFIIVGGLWRDENNNKINAITPMKLIIIISVDLIIII